MPGHKLRVLSHPVFLFSALFSFRVFRVFRGEGFLPSEKGTNLPSFGKNDQLFLPDSRPDEHSDFALTLFIGIFA